MVYYQQEPKKAEHIPFMGQEALPMTQKDIVVHSFELTKSKKLPMVVLKAVDEDYRIWWTMKPEELRTRLKPARTRSPAFANIDATNCAQHEQNNNADRMDPKEMDIDATNCAQHEQNNNADRMGPKATTVMNGNGATNCAQHEQNTNADRMDPKEMAVMDSDVAMDCAQPEEHDGIDQAEALPINEKDTKTHRQSEQIRERRKDSDNTQPQGDGNKRVRAEADAPAHTRPARTNRKTARKADYAY